MINIELYWDNEITDTSTNSKWKRPLSAGEMMAVVLQLCDAGGGDQCMLEVVIRACWKCGGGDKSMLEVVIRACWEVVINVEVVIRACWRW